VAGFEFKKGAKGVGYYRTGSSNSNAPRKSGSSTAKAAALAREQVCLPNFAASGLKLKKKKKRALAESKPERAAPAVPPARKPTLQFSDLDFNDDEGDAIGLDEEDGTTGGAGDDDDDVDEEPQSPEDSDSGHDDGGGEGPGNGSTEELTDVMSRDLPELGEAFSSCVAQSGEVLKSVQSLASRVPPPPPPPHPFSSFS
jgi:hypothetical protein